ncbi:MAG: HK97 gp10 family phage protein [Sneathiellaceae bacterium]
MQLQFQIDGAKAMEQLLQQLGPQVAARAGDQAVRAGAQPIVRAARAKVRKRSGNTAKAIGVKVLRRRRDDTRVAIVGVRDLRFPDPARKNGVDRPALRAHLIERGSSHSPGFPFMRPALDASAPQALEAMGRALGRAIEREALRLAGKLGTKRRRR